MAAPVAAAGAWAPDSGCSSHKYLKVRKVPENPLEGPLNLLSHKGPQPTDRTVQTLRRYDLEKVQKQDPDAALVQLQEEIAKEPTADKLQAFAELAYIAAYKADAVGDNDAGIESLRRGRFLCVRLPV